MKGKDGKVPKLLNLSRLLLTKKSSPNSIPNKIRQRLRKPKRSKRRPRRPSVVSCLQLLKPKKKNRVYNKRKKPKKKIQKQRKLSADLARESTVLPRKQNPKKRRKMVLKEISYHQSFK